QSAPTTTYPLSLHDALPIYKAGITRRRALHLLTREARQKSAVVEPGRITQMQCSLIREALDPHAIIPNLTTEQFRIGRISMTMRSEEHTSELQSRGHLVCRL